MKNKRLALLISGGGTTAEAVIQASARGKLKGIKPVVVISSRKDAGGIAKAKALHISTRVVDPKTCATRAAFGKKILAILRAFDVDVVSQNGWLPLTPLEIIQAYNGNIMNQHPGPLDPGREDFGGKGMYGKRVTCARIAYAWMSGGDFWTESSVHMVTEEFDKGSVLRAVKLRMPSVKKPVSFDALRANTKKLINTTNEVASALLPLEHANVIAVVQLFAKKHPLPSVRRRSPLVVKKDEALLQKAKELAIALFPKG